MNEVIIDTNVVVVANSKAPHASPACFDACITALEEVQGSKCVVIDSGWRIMDEYLRHSSPNAIRGLGDAFVKWLLVRRTTNPGRCQEVRIVPRAEDPQDFDEFPRDADLATFDRSDRKFVAVALACDPHPPILNAGDRGWVRHREALERHGLSLTFLCPDQMTG